MRVAPGTQIGDFLVEGRLGAGGMAEVWVVRDTRENGRFALKVLTSPHSRERTRLLREGRTQGSLTHPHLLPVIATLVHENVTALLLPLVRGPALDAELRDVRLTRDEAIAITLAVTRGIAYAHRRELVHRDIKPSNVLLDLQEGRIVPRVSDFGLVKADDPNLATAQGAVLGTPAYAAPEQLTDARSVDARADLWSIGVLLCELASGHRPFDAPTLTGMMNAVRGPPDLAGLPVDVASVVGDLLRVDPEERIATCALLLPRLEALLPPDADPLGPDSRLAARIVHNLADPRPQPVAWGDLTSVRERFETSDRARVATPLTIGDFLTRHTETVFRDEAGRVHYGRLLLALIAAVGVAVALGECG